MTVRGGAGMDQDPTAAPAGEPGPVHTGTPATGAGRPPTGEPTQAIDLDQTRPVPWPPLAPPSPWAPPDPWAPPGAAPPTSSMPPAPPTSPPPPDGGPPPSPPPEGGWVPAPPPGGGLPPSPPPPQRHRTGLILGAVAGGLTIAVISTLLGGLAGGLVASRRLPPAATLPSPAAGSTSRPAGSIAGIAAGALPAVVTIKVDGAEGDGTGSGFVLRADGYILTNNHVVSSAADSGDITVLFADGTSAPATVRGRDTSYDLAVLRVRRTGLPVLPLGDSDAVVVGDPVVAVGAPLGLDSTVTSGIVSALNRPVTPGGEQSTAYINAIQTDAAINPGNSGGPLLDMSGRVIGVNSAIARIPGASLTGQSGSIGVGFAIPSEQARTTADQLIATGKAKHPIIGVLLDPDYAGPGVKIAGGKRDGKDPVTPGGPADQAGVAAGDVITKLDGKAVVDSSEFVVAIRARKVGDTVRLTFRRDGTERTVSVTLQGASD